MEVTTFLISAFLRPVSVNLVAPIRNVLILDQHVLEFVSAVAMILHLRAKTRDVECLLVGLYFSQVARIEHRIDRHIGSLGPSARPSCSWPRW